MKNLRFLRNRKKINWKKPWKKILEKKSRKEKFNWKSFNEDARKNGLRWDCTGGSVRLYLQRHDVSEEELKKALNYLRNVPIDKYKKEIFEHWGGKYYDKEYHNNLINWIEKMINEKKKK